MKTNLYVITDTKANKTTEPFSCPTDAVAKRNFIFGCLASETPPQDCILWRIGSFSIDDTEAVSFSFLNTDNVVVNCTVEEIEAYAKVYAMMNPDDTDEKKFSEFVEKGVLA